MEYLCSGNNNLELMPIINSFNNTIEINNLLIKDKIRRKIDTIKNMKYYGFPIMNYNNIHSKSILEKLYNIDKKKNILVYSDEVNKLLGNIVHNIFEYSKYQVLLSNVPEYSITREDSNFQLIDCYHIYDTMAYYVDDNAVSNVFQVSNSSYLIQFVDDDVAKYICDLLHNNMIGSNVIRVEYIGKQLEKQKHQIHIEDSIDECKDECVDYMNNINTPIDTFQKPNILFDNYKKIITNCKNTFNMLYNFMMLFIGWK